MKKKLVLMTSALMAMSLLSACNQHQHSFKEVAEVPATCTEVGTRAHYTCEGCDKIFDADKKETTLDALKISALGHDYQFNSFVWEGFTAQAKYVCSRDANHVEMHDANVTDEVTTPAGCESKGVRTYTASYDGHTDTKTAEVEATGHNWGTPTYTWSDDNKECTATRVCANDATHVETEKANAQLEVVDPTCGVDGKETYTAAFKNEAFETQEKVVTLPAIEHDYQFAEFVWAEDFSAQAKFVCTHNETHVDLREATVSSEITTEPSCTVDGVRTYTASYGDHSDTKDQAIPAGHKWGETTYDWAEDHSSCTATRVCEYNHEHVVSETANSTNAVTKESTCGEEGVRTYTAHFESELLQDGIYEESIPMSDHKWGEVTYAYNDDHTQCTASRTCEYSSEHVDSETARSSVKWEDQGESKEHYLGYRCFDFKNEQFEDKKELLFQADLKLEYWDGFLVRAPEGVTLYGRIDIPAYIEKGWYPVNAITSYGFYGQLITSVSISSNMEVIEEYAFANCNNLKTVYYGGDMWDWTYMNRADNWCEDSPVEKIVCSDGTITL